MKRALLALVFACAHAPPPTINVSANKVVSAHSFSSVLELDSLIYVFENPSLSDNRLAILREGIPLATVSRPPCDDQQGATTINAPDGNGRWVVCAGDGLFRITKDGAIDDVSARFGLVDVEQVAASGGTTAFATKKGIAFTVDGKQLETIDDPGETLRIVVAKNRLARQTDKAVEVWDLVRHTRISYAFAPPAVMAFIDASSDHARLAISTRTGVFVEDRGALRRLALPRPKDGWYKISAAGSRLWIAKAGRGFFVLDGARLSRLDTSFTANFNPEVIARDDANAWVINSEEPWTTARGEDLFEISTTHAIAAHAADAGWQASIAPVFQRVCAHCHLPGGDAGIDLSTAASWAAERHEIKDRVLVTKTMPPAGTEMSDADRRIIEAWLTK